MNCYSCFDEFFEELEVFFDEFFDEFLPDVLLYELLSFDELYESVELDELYELLELFLDISMSSLNIINFTFIIIFRFSNKYTKKTV